MTAFAAVLLVGAAAVVVGLVIALTWAHFDRLRADNERLRKESHRLTNLVGEVCEQRDDALDNAREWASIADERGAQLERHLFQCPWAGADPEQARLS